jgi:hypothetical protein
LDIERDVLLSFNASTPGGQDKEWLAGEIHRNRYKCPVSELLVVSKSANQTDRDRLTGIRSGYLPTVKKGHFSVANQQSTGSLVRLFVRLFVPDLRSESTGDFVSVCW